MQLGSSLHQHCFTFLLGFFETQTLLSAEGKTDPEEILNIPADRGIWPNTTSPPQSTACKVQPSTVMFPV